MGFVVVYFVGLGLLLILACASLYFSFKKFRKERRIQSLKRQRYRKGKFRVRKEVTDWVRDWFADFSGELVGAFIGTLVFGLLVTLAQSAQEEKSEKTRLIIQLGSESNSITLAASEELLARGWLRDGTLRNHSFIGANLQGLFLKGADFEGSYLNWANMKGVTLFGANLIDTNFFAADLCGALLGQADLSNAELMGVDLREADFYNARLNGTSFLQADLRGASFAFALFDENTILPDGSSLDVNQNIQEQLDVFTNPNHPDFIPFFDKNDEYQSLATPNCLTYRPTDLPR